MKRLSRAYIGAMGAILILILLLWTLLSSLPDGKLHVYFLDVGQGDAVLVRAPTDEFILIDGGPDDAVIAQLARVMPFYERQIDLIILSHPHADHVNGLVEVLKRYKVKQVIMTGVSYKFPGYLAFLEQINQQKIPVKFAGAGSVEPDSLKFGKGASTAPDFSMGNLFFDMLFPMRSLQGERFENLNNSSIALRMIFKDKIFYFSGDAEQSEEEKIVASGQDLNADVYKVGHHGSRTSSLITLIDKVKPSSAIISCGLNNKFKHPHAVTIEKLLAKNIDIFRTDLNGMIEAKTDGINLQLLAWDK